jgi:hypothetical protein
MLDFGIERKKCLRYQCPVQRGGVRVGRVVPE